LMISIGFTKEYCGAINLEYYNSNNMKIRLKRMKSNMFKNNNPHLIYIGKKND